MAFRFPLFLLLALFFVFTPQVFAQGDSDLIEDLVAPTFEEQLSEIYSTLQEKEQERLALIAELGAASNTAKKNQLTQEIAIAEDVINGLREEVVDLSTGGAELFVEQKEQTEEFDWRKDLEQIFEPLLNQLRDLSERPRAIEKLNAEIEFWEKRETELSIAVINLEKNVKEIESPELQQELTGLLTTAKAREKTAKQKLSLLENDLYSLESQDSPVWETLGDIFMETVIAMVLHVLAAIGAAAIIYQLVKLVSLLAIGLVQKRFEDGVFTERAIVVGRTLLGGLLAVMTYFIVLYSFSEWLLLVVSLLIIAGVVIGLKDAVPAYFTEIKTLLNMGSIRQGEKIEFNGLPWIIKKLNVHTHLHNPELDGHLRVPLKQLLLASSRPFHDDEPWFPTSEGDVIFMEDGTFGRVKRQSPDIVEVDLGGSIYTYQTTNFLGGRPRNLSREGFTVYEVFGLDYSHQAEITTTILEKYTAAIEAAVKGSAFAEHNTYLGVEFDNASASSLDFKVIASFTGEIGMDFFKIKRLLQKASVEIANKEGWVIPFQQMTVHYQPVQ